VTVAFEQATKRQARARIAITGPAGAGKTYTALRLAKGMGSKVALIDTEHGSASKYADEFSFAVVQLTNFHPERYIEAMKAAESGGYDVLVIDSASHEWNGIGGCLELVDAATPRAGGNSYAAWKDVTPLHNRFIEAIHASKCHVLATFRSKMEYVQGEKGGRKTVEKLGLAPVTRDGAEYEFDIVLDVDLSHTGVISKSRARDLADTVHKKPGEELAALIVAWLSDGKAPVENKEAGATPPNPGANPLARPPAPPLSLGEIGEIAQLYSLGASLPRTPKTKPQVEGMVMEHGFEKTLKSVESQHRLQCGSGCPHITDWRASLDASEAK
jgi:hypothetical protein